MLNFLRAYKNYDPAAKSMLEIAFLYPGPKAVFFHRVAHLFYGVRLFFFARWISEFSRFCTGIEIHPGAKIGQRLVIDHGMGLVIGETAVVGNDCLLFHGVTLGGMDTSKTKRHPTLGNEVIVGSGAKILGNIVLGDHCKIGANAVVTKSIPAGATAVGIPARVV